MSKQEILSCIWTTAGFLLLALLIFKPRPDMHDQLILAIICALAWTRGDIVELQISIERHCSKSEQP